VDIDEKDILTVDRAQPGAEYADGQVFIDGELIVLLSVSKIFESRDMLVEWMG
jgi:chemotaxis signal transduction protein